MTVQGTRDPMWSVDDLAAYLGVPVATIYKWRTTGDAPPGYRIGRHLRFKPADVDQWLTERRDKK
jgi:excisionase family DNA binding protein